MKKQKVCIIGGGLTGLATAVTLSRLNLDIDLISANNINNSKKSVRTTAISQSNYDFLKKLKICNFSKNEFWPCSKIKLYTKGKNKKFYEIYDLDKHEKKQKKIFYMIDNAALAKLFINNIKKKRSIHLNFGKKISNIIDSGLLKSIKFGNEYGSKYNSQSII